MHCIFHALWDASSSEDPLTHYNWTAQQGSHRWLIALSGTIIIYVMHLSLMKSCLTPSDILAGLTFADNSGIFMMAAVVLTPAQVETLWQPKFMATAFHIVQQDWTGTVAKVGLSLGCTSRTTTNLPAHYVGIVHVPVIITHCSPNSFVEDLYPTWAATVAVHQTNGWFGWTKIDIMTQLGSNRIWANVSELQNVTDRYILCV